MASRPEDTEEYLAELHRSLAQRKAQLEAAKQAEAQRAESRRAMIQAVVQGQAAAEKREERKAQELRSVNRVQLPPGYERHDDFGAAQARLAAGEQILATLDAEHEARMRAIEKFYAEKRRHIRVMQRAREALGAERFDAARAEAQRRRGK